MNKVTKEETTHHRVTIQKIADRIINKTEMPILGDDMLCEAKKLGISIQTVNSTMSREDAKKLIKYRDDR